MKYLRLLVIITSVIFIGYIVTTAIEGEEGRLKKIIYKNKRFVEKKNLLGLVQNISINYSDEFGNDRQLLLFIAKHFFDKCDSIRISLRNLEVKINKDMALSRFEATVYWKEKASREMVYSTVKSEAEFRKEQNQWKLTGLKFIEPENADLLNPALT